MSVIFVAGIPITIPTLISLIGILAGEVRAAAVMIYLFMLLIGATVRPVVAMNLLHNGSILVPFETLATLISFSFHAS